MEWTTVTVIIALVGLGAAVIKPIVSLTQSITKLTVVVERLERELDEQHKVLILVHNIQVGPEDGEKGVLLSGGVEKLVVDVQLQHIPLPQPRVPLGALPVDLHPLEADVLLGQGGGEEGEGLAQPAVQPLSGVVSSDGKFFHSSPAFRSFFTIIPQKEKNKRKAFDIDEYFRYNVRCTVMRRVPCV